MREDSRLQAAIDVLGRILTAGEAADRALRAWGRANRFAGSGDRRAIAAHVYAALRAARDADPRTAMIAALQTQELDAAGIEALFSGALHAPAPLTPAERLRLGRIAARDDWLMPSLRRAFGARAEDELAALKGRAPLDLRVNTMKATLDQARAALAGEGIVTEAVPAAATALRVIGGSRDVEAGAAFAAGLVEIQDAGSQAVCDLADARTGMEVLDLCAGAGGKALALAAQMGNEGRVLAADIAPVRLKRLLPRALRAGATIVETMALAPDWLDGPSPFEGVFDRVIVDAPCSGSGTWRRNPETRLRLTPERLADLAALQIRLLDAAAPLVKPGGRLLYITCSLLPEEGEDVAAAFLARHPDWQAARAPQRFSPAATGTDGFFAALFRHA